MAIVMDNVLTGVVFTLIGGFLGFVFMALGVFLVPKLMNFLTPNINEEKEIVRGNVAVANYFGSIVQATIIGLSIIIAAALIAGLHG